MRSYCVKERHVTESINPRYEKAKNGRMMMKSTCASCGITKSQFVKSDGHSLSKPSSRKKRRA